ncbi:hypothetical protein L1987_33106 [Smallanthus sonchifolius]|uniref:Uncharacterized protein n=1 Tax=Smallanthus sonchifolius TaxID=185202 RepID=A0ACB9HPV0_9ASTR|nr:hypothetical protein L1987_33106 [Smallanthus sonchifolius]
MGNAMAACCLTSESSFVKVIYWEGNTRTLTGKRWIAGEIMIEFPDSMVCNADCFFIGHPIPALTIDDQLKPGQTYFVLPLDIFSSKTLSASSISALVGHTPKRTAINFKECPFEYLKGSNGRVLIKVSPEFMARILTRRGGQENESISGDATKGFLCSTPELKKVYEQLVGSKDQTWSPKLETISEHNKIRYSPYRLIGLEWKDKEVGA